MNTEQMSFKQALRAMIDAEAHPPRDQVELAELIAYVEGALSPDDEARVRDYLARHPEAARLVVGYHDFLGLEPREATESLSDDDVATHWRLFERRLRGGADLSEPVPLTRSQLGSWWQRQSVYTLAAGVVLGVVSMLLLWRLDLRRERLEPELNVAVHDLFPTTSQNEVRDERSDELSAATTLIIPARSGAVLLALNLADLRSFSAYRLKLSTADGQALLTLDGLARGVDDGFTVQLPRDLLPPATYQAELFGLASTGDEELLARYRFATVFQE